MKKIVTVSSFLIAIVSPFGVLAADENPLGALFSALENIGKPASTSDTSAAQKSESVSDDQIMADLRTQAGSHPEVIGHYSYGEHYSRFRADMETSERAIQAALDSGNYSQTARLSEIAAQSFANVAFQRNKGQNAQQRDYFLDSSGKNDVELNKLSLADFAEMVGSKLVICLQAKKSSGMDIRNTIDQRMAARAKNFLTYAQAHGVPEATSNLNELDKTIGKEAQASNVAALAGSAEMVVEKFNANRFGFDQKYLGKTITASGTIRTITGNSNSATIRILGNPKKSKDERGFNDEIACVIVDPQSMAKAGDLGKGNPVKVRGVYDHDTHFNMMAGSQVNLSGCEILK